MSGRSELHFDRGDGTCGYCFEEWECRGSQGAVWSGIQEWEQEEWRDSWERERERKRSVTAMINETFAEAGLDIELHQDVSGQMLTFEQFVALALKLREMLDSGTSGTVD